MKKMVKSMMVKSKKTRSAWIIFLVVALGLGATLFGFLGYQPALIAASGYQVHLVTDPGWLNGRTKTIQAISEQTPCLYTLLGWQEETAFYYQADCGTDKQLWRYDTSLQQAEMGVFVPTELYIETAAADTIIESVLANVYPRELGTVSREIFIVGDVLPSANGRFTALISRHVYGPQDVLLLMSDGD